MAWRRSDKTKGSVLVVDDSPAVIEKAEEILRGADYRVRSLDGAELLEDTARNDPPDLLLLSSHLETANVQDLCIELGGDRQLAGIPIVILQDRMATTLDFGRDHGVYDSIYKPFEADSLLAVVEHTLAKARGRVVEPERIGTDDDEGNEDDDGHREPLGDPIERVARALGTDATERSSLAERLRGALNGRAFRDDVTALTSAEPQPALAGDLEAVPLAEIMQLLSLQRQTGILTVRKGGADISLVFEYGAVRGVRGVGTPSELLLGNVVVRRGLMSAHEVKVLLSSRHGDKYRLGTQMVALGYLTQAQLHAALRLQSAELVYELLRWRKGRLTFERTSALPEEILALEFELRTDELLMEGFRRVDEWGLIEQTLPSLDAVPHTVAGARTDGLEYAERLALTMVNGRRSLRDIIDAVGEGTFAGARVLYRLVAARVIAVAS